MASASERQRFVSAAAKRIALASLTRY